MAENIEIKIKAAVEAAEAANNIGQLRRSLLDLQTLAENVEIGSQQFNELQESISQTTFKLADTRDKLEDFQDAVQTLKGTPVERMTASFGLLRDSIFNLDFEKAKIGVQGLANSFSPLGPDGAPIKGLKAIGPVLSGLGAGVTQLGTTFISLGRALLVNPIFLLAAIIGAIGVAIVGLLNKLGLLQPILNAIGAAVEYVTDTFNYLTEAIGLTTAASDKHLATISENAEKEREELNKTYANRVAISQALEGLDSRQIDAIGKITGMYIQQDKTLADIQREGFERRKASFADEIQKYEEIERKNKYLNDEQKKKLGELRDAYEKTNIDIIALEANKFKKLQDMEDRNQQMRIDAIKNDAERAKAQAKFDTEQAQKSRDQVALLIQKENEALFKGNVAAAKDARRQIDAITQERMLLEQKAEREKQEKLGEIYKESLDKQKQNARKALDDLIELGKLQIRKEADNSREKVNAIIKSENDIYTFKEKNAKLLELDQVKLEAANLDRFDRIKKAEEDYAKSTFGLRKAQTQNFIDEINAELDRFNSTLADSTRTIALPYNILGEEITASSENIKKVQLSLQFDLLQQTKKLLQTELEERTKNGKLTVEEKDKFSAQIAAIDEKIYAKTKERLDLEYELARTSYEKESEEYRKLQEDKFKNLEGFTKRDADELIIQSGKRSIALKNAFQDELNLREATFLQQNNLSAFQLATDVEWQKKLAKFNEDTIKQYNERRIQIEKQTTDDIKKLNEGVYKSNTDMVENQLKKTNDLSINRVAVISQGLRQTISDLNSFQSTEISMLAQSYMDKNNLTFEQLQADKDLFAQFTAEKKAIDDAYNAQRIIAAEEAAQRIADARAKEAQQIYGITQNLTESINILTDIGFMEDEKRAKGNFVEEEKLAKKKFELNKGLQVALAIADGYRAATSYVATNPLFTFGIPNPLAIIGLATTIALSVANVAKILATQYQSRTPPSIATGGGGAGGGGGAPAPTTPIFQPGQFFGLGGQAPVQVGVGGPNIVGPQKVFVVETDITSAQRNVRGIEQRAEIE